LQKWVQPARGLLALCAFRRNNVGCSGLPLKIWQFLPGGIVFEGCTIVQSTF
jgi:hypothetical protein